MNLDDLISKYLDGELLEHEDRELRSELSDNPAAKEDFDEAVIINSALREDARSIEPPNEFLLETEERILMKILSTYPVAKDTVYKKPVSRIKYFSAAIVAVILLGFIRLGDNFSTTGYNPGFGIALNSYKSDLDDEMLTHTYIITNQDNNAKSNINRRISNGIMKAEKRNPSSDKLTENRNDDAVEISLNNESNDINRTNNRNSQGNNDNDNIGTDVMNEEIAFELPDRIDFTSPVTELSTLQLQINSDINSISTDIKLPPVQQKSINNMILSGNSFYKSDISVSSFLGTDLLKDIDNKNNKAFNHISQSLAYSFSTDDRMGVEFGYTEYSVIDIIGSDLIAFNQVPPIIKSGTSKVQTAEGFNSSQGNNVNISKPYIYNHTKQLYWGAAFYERTLVNTSDLALNFRLGVGSSSDGALGFGKIYAKYNIFSGFNLTVGTEGRLFMARFSSEDNRDILRKSFSLIYGFQIVF
jgi:hypothetical protein